MDAQQKESMQCHTQQTPNESAEEETNKTRVEILGSPTPRFPLLPDTRRSHNPSRSNPSDPQAVEALYLDLTSYNEESSPHGVSQRGSSQIFSNMNADSNGSTSAGTGTRVIVPSSNDSDEAVYTNQEESDRHNKPYPNRRTQQLRSSDSPTCMQCQRQKTKSPQASVCEACRVNNVGHQNRPSRKRRARASLNDQSANSVGPTAGRSEIEESLMQMISRIVSLEQHCAALRLQVGWDSNIGLLSPQSHGDPADNIKLQSEPGEDLPAGRAFPGRTNLLEQFGILDRLIAGEKECQRPSKGPNRGPSPVPGTWDDLRRGIEKPSATLVAEDRLSETASMKIAVDIFFESLHPHYPCLNENQFRAQFEAFLEEDTELEVSYYERQQFVALVSLMHAEVQILSDDWSTSSRAPGWQQFCRAENILDRITWLGNGDLTTIQCFILKARYLLYLERANGAYDSIGRAVRLCWLLGLHDQQSWTECTPFEVAFRQRLFWTLFYVERNIAFNAGAPYLIRESDFSVSLPPNLDDTSMFPGRPLPPIAPGADPFHPYLSAASRWGRLCSEIWDTMFGVHAAKPTSREFVMSMDARIRFWQSKIPLSLRWERTDPRLDGNCSNTVRRQSVILLLRMNQLRLLLRQEPVLSLTYNHETAKECLAVASNSIEVIDASYRAPTSKPTDRYSATLYLTGSLVQVVCILVKHENPHDIRSEAIALFKKATWLLEDMSPTFSAARHTMKRLARILDTARKEIWIFEHPEQGLLLNDNSGSHTLVPDISDFLNHDCGFDLGLEYMSTDLSNPFSIDLGMMLDPDFSRIENLSNQIFRELDMSN